MSDLANKIEHYFNKRGLKWPTTEKALMFSETEMAEVYEHLLAEEGGWTRNNPENKPEYDNQEFAKELGDVIMMVMVAGMVRGLDPIDALVQKMENKLAKLES